MPTFNFFAGNNAFDFQANADITNNTGGPITVENLSGNNSTVIPPGAMRHVNCHINKVNYNGHNYFPERNGQGTNHAIAVTYNGGAPAACITFTWH